MFVNHQFNRAHSHYSFIHRRTHAQEPGPAQGFSPIKLAFLPTLPSGHILDCNE